MGFLDWIKDKIAEDQFNLEDNQKYEPLEDRLKDGLKSFIDAHYVIPYSSQPDYSRYFGRERVDLSSEVRNNYERNRANERWDSLLNKAEVKVQQSPQVTQNTNSEPGVRYSLPSTDDMEGLSRQAEAFASNNNQYVDATSFTDSLRMLVIKSGLDNADIYKRANLSKSVFSSIFANEHIPKKGTVVALAIALELNLEETERLLMKAGYTFSNSIKADLIAVYFINHKIYDIDKLNAALYEYGEPILGSKSF